MDENSVDFLDTLSGKNYTFLHFTSFPLNVEYLRTFFLFFSGIPSEEVLEKLLSDPTFVDYVNTFLSLPVHVYCVRIL